MGFGQAVLMPSTLAYLSEAKPDNVGAAGSLMMFLCFTLACIICSVAVIAVDTIGVQYFFLFLALLMLALTAWASFTCYTALRETAYNSYIAPFEHQ